MQIDFRNPTAVSGLRLPASVMGGGSFQLSPTLLACALTVPAPAETPASRSLRLWSLRYQTALAYDGGDEPLDFFNRFFAAWKSGQYFNGASAYDDKVALTASVSWAMPQPKRLLAFAPSGSWFRGAPPTMPEQEP